VINKICVRGFRPSVDWTVDQRESKTERRSVLYSFSILFVHQVFRALFGYIVIRFVSAKFGSCTGVSVNGTLVKAKLCTFTLECTHFIFN
jgi:hypothetical protein